MSLDNKQLTHTQKFLQLPSRYTPTPINLDLRLEERIARVERKGHLSVKLSYFKKQLEPIQQPPHIKQLKIINKMRENRRLSLQVLPKLQDYQLPISQSPQKLSPESEQKSPRKKAPFLKHHNNKFKKIAINDSDDFDKIDRILFRVIEQENIVDRRIEEDIEKHLTHSHTKRDEESKMIHDAKVQLLEKLNYEYRKLDGNNLQKRIKERLLSSKETADTKYKSHSFLVAERKKKKKEMEYKGWEIQRAYEHDDFFD